MNKHVEQHNGYRVIRRGEPKESIIPIDCPLCSCVLMDEIDEIAIVRSGCCFECEVEIADPNREQWIKGWRPEKSKLDEIKVRRLSSPHSRKHI